ncbi:hypothetical protein QBC33DRAFT_256498 [Phialemonium atrogriseum]|uniref:Zn(2)-C6 fungal-type domain-containing protein n=1 Tax=Phialemonium atrogriseum TaxID=1093897 RepID=A0AAJ0BSR5_9PEZI|nr:uncharacterized protein QBC33DRAFT_256498 [Phialemonium atrogriseum]KAK1762723.1 hypothetical protein QBC33DRAFT_256498 [Phialemonium atrogriseum]
MADSPQASPAPDAHTPPRRKRRRQTKSCQQCRQRKIRCDQGLPCRPCVRARAQLQCSYRSSIPGSGVNTAPASEPRTGRPLTVASPTPSLDRTSNPLPNPRLLPPIADQPPQHRAEATVRTQGRDHLSIPGSADHEEIIRELRQRVHRLETQLAEKPDQATGHTNTSSGSFIPATFPRLRNAADKTKLFGKSHWLHTAEKFQTLGKFDAVELEPSFNHAFDDVQAELNSIVKDTRSLRRAVKAHDSAQLNNPVPDLLNTLPAKATCDKLVRCYLQTFEPVYRVVHVPTFWKEYNQFWEQTQIMSTSSPFVMKLVLVLAIGTVFLPDTADIDRATLHRLAQTWIYAAQWWLTGPSEKSIITLDGLQVFCLLIIARQATHNSPGGSVWLSTGSLMTMAMAMGLHRNPNMFLPTLSPFQVQMRVRLWTTVLELALQSCLNSGLPLGISIHDYDTVAPSNFDDQDLDPSGSAEPAPDDQVTDSSVQILLAKSLPLRLKVAQLLNDFRGEPSYETALKLGTDLRAACRDVAIFFHSAIPQPLSDASVLSRTDFHRRFLGVYLRKYILLLHRPFMLQARKDPRYYMSRKICVESAMAIGSYSREANSGLAAGVLDDLSRLSMVAAGCFKGALTMDIIMVLSLEVITQLEEESPRDSAPDPLDDILKANRAPLIQTLEHIAEQLLQGIALGSASMKRYIFVSGYLSQIRAMESGRCVKQAIYTSLIESMKKCHSLLQEYRPVMSPQVSATQQWRLSSHSSSGLRRLIRPGIFQTFCTCPFWVTMGRTPGPRNDNFVEFTMCSLVSVALAIFLASTRLIDTHTQHRLRSLPGCLDGFPVLIKANVENIRHITCSSLPPLSASKIVRNKG